MSYPVILPSLGRVSSCRSRIGKPFFSAGDAYTYWPRAFPTHTGIGPCNSSNTEEQGARVGPNMRLQTMCFASRSPLFFIPRTLAALDLSSFMYFLPLIAVRGYDWITYILKRTGYQLPLSCPGFMDITRIFFFETNSVPETTSAGSTRSFQNPEIGQVVSRHVLL